MNTSTTTSAITTFASVPKRASDHEVTIASCERSTAGSPSIQNERGQNAMHTAVADMSKAETSQSIPSGREMGCVSAVTSASPNAFTNPRR